MSGGDQTWRGSLSSEVAGRKRGCSSRRAREERESLGERLAPHEAVNCRGGQHKGEARGHRRRAQRRADEGEERESAQAEGGGRRARSPAQMVGDVVGGCRGRAQAQALNDAVLSFRLAPHTRGRSKL